MKMHHRTGTRHQASKAGRVLLDQPLNPISLRVATSKTANEYLTRTLSVHDHSGPPRPACVATHHGVGLSPNWHENGRVVRPGSHSDHLPAREGVHRSSLASPTSSTLQTISAQSASV
jgi:hypothetical protein